MKQHHFRLTAAVLALCVTGAPLLPAMPAAALAEPGENEVAENGVVFHLYGNRAEVVGLTEHQEQVVIPATVNDLPVTAIGSYAFQNDELMEAVSIPRSVTIVRTGAFDGCKALTDVWYGGSHIEWDLLSIGAYNWPLKDAEHHFAEPDDPEVCTSVTLYYLDESYQEYLSIPEDYLSSYQIPAGADAEYKVIQNFSTYQTSCDVSETGLVTISVGDWGAPSNDALIAVTQGEERTYVRVTPASYAQVYANECIDAYLAENYTEDMTLEETLDMICRYPASFDYSPYFSGYVGMLCAKGGDCWASTSLILQLCKRLGLTAYSRNGNRDPGAGSGHMNALVITDDGYYELEAGYSGTAPRPYHVTKRSSLFCFKSAEGGYEVYQYDGKDTDMTTLEIPAEYNGKPVVGIGQSFLSRNTTFTEVIIPETVTYIRDSAFNSMENLQTLRIPATVEEIGNFVFTNCNMLDLTIDPDNSAYTMADGVVYDKDMTTLLYAPSVTEIIVPETVTAIADYSLYYNQSLTSVTLHDGIETIGEGAFAACTSIPSLIIPAGVQSVSDFAFYEMDALQSIAFLGKDTVIGEEERTITAGAIIYGYADSTAQAYAEANDRSFVALDGPGIPTQGIPGDVNGDERLDARDLTRMKQYLLSRGKLTVEERLRADMNNDGAVTAADVVLLSRYLLCRTEE